MKRNSILFSITILNIFCTILSMENPHKSLNPLKDTLTKAFSAFGIDASPYSIHEDCYNLTPDEQVRHWERIDKEVIFTHDICLNPALTEFAAYCVAADVKNSGYLKSQVGFWGTSALMCAVIPLAYYVSQNSTYKLPIFLGSTTATIVAAWPKSLVTKIWNKIDNEIATTAFSHACAKLIEQRNYKPLATYYAFATGTKHSHVERDQQFSIINRLLKIAGVLITAERSGNSIEVKMLGSLGCSGNNGQIASATYITKI